MYQVLYRKWRPHIFDDVCGQEHITTTLKNELLTDRVNHAYLFTGSRGTGKTTCAKIFAKAVNCLNLQNGNPCCECENCKGIEKASILDVLEIDAASNNSVENIRQIIEESIFAPTKAKYRVYIIDEVHMLSIGAFNALLKTLEEPSSHVVFILATTEVHKIPATILSRCQRFDFNKISVFDIASRLEYIAKEEQTLLDNDVAMLIASLSDGALRDALSILDRCVSGDREITSEVVRQVTGLASSEYLYNTIEAIKNKDCTKALQIINDLHVTSKDMVKFNEEIIIYLRDIMVIKSMNNARSLIIMSDEKYQKVKNQADNITLNEVIHAMDKLQMAIEKISKGANKRIETEVTFIKICSPKFDDSMEALLSRVATLERNLKNGLENLVNINIDEITAKKKDDIIEEDKKKDEIIEEVKSDKKEKVEENTLKVEDNLQEFDQFSEVLDILMKNTCTLAHALNGSKAYLSENEIIIDTDKKIGITLLEETSNKDALVQALKQVTGRYYSIKLRNVQNDKILSQSELDIFTSNLLKSGVTLNQEN